MAGLVTTHHLQVRMSVGSTRSAMAGLSSEIIFDLVSSEDLPSALKIEQEG